MSELVVYSLIGCPYSIRTENILNDKKINFNLIKVKQEEKQKIKEKNAMRTFPQIFFNSNNQNIKIGGHDNIVELFSIIDQNKYNNNFENLVSEFNKKITTDKKNLLKIIEKLI